MRGCPILDGEELGIGENNVIMMKLCKDSFCYVALHKENHKSGIFDTEPETLQMEVKFCATEQPQFYLFWLL
jgi:hypothetical protein